MRRLLRDAREHVVQGEGAGVVPGAASPTDADPWMSTFRDSGRTELIATETSPFGMSLPFLRGEQVGEVNSVTKRRCEAP
jgi:hypothetical protein